ncbi:GntR family transcriptional regulator [Aquabacter spiritensis]|uniref:DNA-binding GntR family transcriptional regulator n=1 Tax=Aquabacter spiritensis TaxID=933073 RepID=A0A4R3LVK0_9HYPH|nr:GntR family transcriptional regulator [Aquabacter spiritensis]TCT04584.1 DNA-binding GntR family transcriptional regulator [Aquabacter spiritensis]
MSHSPLVTQIAGQILDQIRSGVAPPGAQLVERKLADQFRVSRSPVRQALMLLESAGQIAPNPRRGGYLVLPQASCGMAPVRAVDEEEAAYLAIAEHRLQGRLPEKVSETKLAQAYRLSQAQVRRVLARIANEGWIARLPGHGWGFLPMLTSMQAYRDSYRFRLVIEPAAILEPGFTLDRPALLACRDQQQALVEGAIWTVSNAALFDLNSRLHETIIECSRNLFFIESLKRIDRLRRLIEYRQSLDRKYAVVRSREHLHLIDLLLQDDRAAAAAYMRRHLASVSIEKMMERPPRASDPDPAMVDRMGERVATEQPPIQQAEAGPDPEGTPI